jgi:hypothetical protein
MLCAYSQCRKEFTPKNSRGRFCSGRCRSAAWEEAHTSIKREEIGNLRALFNTALESLWEAKAALEKYLG